MFLLPLMINNASYSRLNMIIKGGLNQRSAILEALKLRKRPIYISTCTTTFGMLPLMLSPGEGAEIYQGLAAVIIGDMTVSALFTLSFFGILSLPLFTSFAKTYRSTKKIITADAA
ncbi:efflux RND transporter permease subunit [Thalassomonas sp. RHCl1]|uniref:efflux RND transporter permease subunit n=1 Tax=Thalassomonas sp. RHCl1 TaxID=2995320 RepID=UPI0032B1E4B8